MEFFRSETMQYFKIVIPKANSVRIMSALEAIGHLHFVDKRMTAGPSMRTYYSESARKCDELLTQISEIERKMTQHKVPIERPHNIRKLYRLLQEESLGSRADDERVFSDLEHNLTSVFQQLHDNTSRQSELTDAIKEINKEISFFRLLDSISPPEGFR